MASKSRLLDPGVDQPAVQLGPRAGQRAADQPQPRQACRLRRDPCRAGRAEPRRPPAGRPAEGVARRSRRSGTSRCRWPGRRTAAGRSPASSGTPRASAASTTSRPVASASVSLNSIGPQVVLADVMIDDHLDRLAVPRITSAILPNWTQAVVSSTMSTSRSASCSGVMSLPNCLTFCCGIEERQVRRHGEVVDQQHVLAQLLEDGRHAPARCPRRRSRAGRGRSAGTADGERTSCRRSWDQANHGIGQGSPTIHRLIATALPGPRHVLGHLRHELLGGVESPNVPQAGQESQSQSAGRRGRR